MDRPEIQKFAGALQGEKATKGLFITTAKFSSGARQYAENLHGSTIVLIDGTQLMKLMLSVERWFITTLITVLFLLAFSMNYQTIKR